MRSSAGLYFRHLDHLRKIALAPEKTARERLHELLFEELRYAVRVVRSALQAAKNQDFERALEEFERFPWIVYRRHPTYLRPRLFLVKLVVSRRGTARRARPRN